MLFEIYLCHRVGELLDSLDWLVGFLVLEVPNFDLAVVAPSGEYGGLSADSDAVDAGVVGAELFEDRAGGHIPLECHFVSTAGDEFAVVIRDSDIVNLVIVRACVLFDDELLIRVPEDNAPVLGARKEVLLVAVELGYVNGSLVALESLGRLEKM